MGRKPGDGPGVLKGLVFDIQRFSTQDGPGIRTTVFMKGCPLKCLWCHNAESIDPNPQLMYTPQRCIGCDNCQKTCPKNAISTDLQGAKHIDRGLCDRCGLCAEGCYAGALTMVGRWYDVDELLDIACRDMPFYQQSGGGVTVSGGEPSHQTDFVVEFLHRCRLRRIHTAIDTCGYTAFHNLKALAEQSDLVLYDIKHTDLERHRELTGVPNDIILENLAKLDELGVPIIIRVPVIPGYNDDIENMHRLGDLLAHLTNVGKVELLPYHRLGESKYNKIGYEYRLKGLEPPSGEKLEKLRDVLESESIPTMVREL